MHRDSLSAWNGSPSTVVVDSPVNRVAGAVLWDACEDRAKVVTEIAIAAGARIVRVQGQPQAADTKGRAALALVGIGLDADARSNALALVRTLRGHCHAVLAYEDGVAQWPLATRAQTLLAGSTRLLDSAACGFQIELALRIEEALHGAKQRCDDETQLRETMRSCGIMGQSVPMLRFFEWVARISAFSQFCVLLEGESGTGKDLLARAIHRLDPRRKDGPFVAVNCASLAKTLAQSELFGHRRGSFTGADRDRMGLVRAAEGGVLFLDEIGELDLEVQGKLLHVLQNGRVMGVGEERDVPVDVRVVAATHRNLGVMVSEGRFREDLLHRLEALSVQVPPLRDRPDDIQPLVQFFVDKYRDLAQSGRVEASSEFLEALTQIDLRGNVRQLENIVRHAIARKRDQVPLGLPDLSPDLLRRLVARAGDDVGPSSEHSMQGPPMVVNDLCLDRALARYERSLVEIAVQRAQGNQSETARLLGITPRSVYTKLRKYRIDDGRRA